MAVRHARSSPHRLRQKLEARRTAEIRSEHRDLIRRAGFFDHSWVALQLGRSFASLDDAIDAYLSRHATCSPHPLFQGRWLDRAYGRPPKGANALVWYLQNPAAHQQSSPHPLIDVEVMCEARPELREHEFGPVVAWLADLTAEAVLPTPPNHPRTTWGEVMASSRQALSDWARIEHYRSAPRTRDDPPTELIEPYGRRLEGSGGTPLVSIVMPVWNRARVLRRAVESIQTQSHEDWELLLVDDGSEDDSVAVARGLANFDPRIVVLEMEHRGVSSARNAGVAEARSPYVAFLDTDNVWRPDFLHVMLTELTQHSWAMAHGALRAEKDGEEYFRAFEGTHEHLLVANHVDLNVLVVRKERLDAVGGFDETLRRGVDYDLILKLAKGSPLHLVPYIGVDYTDDLEAGERISTSESTDWLSVIATRHLVDWHDVARRPRTAGLTSVVVPVDAGMRVTVDWLRLLANEPDIEVVLVGVRLRRWQHVLLQVVVDSMENRRMVSVSVPRGLATALNVGFAACNGDRVVVAKSSRGLDPSTLTGLADALADPDAMLAQPVVLGPDDLVASAGAVFGSDRVRPRPFLEQHPVSDVARLGGGTHPVPALLSPVFAVRAEDLARPHGLDPLCAWQFAGTELSLRLSSQAAGSSVLVPHLQVTSTDPVLPDAEALRDTLRLFDQRFDRAPAGSRHCWEAAGFEVVARSSEVVDADPSTPPDPGDRLMRLPRAVVRPIRATAIAEAAPSLRWALDLASPAGPAGERWGDTHFGSALGRALSDLGQHVSIDPRQARHRATRDLDDVILVLRGLDRVEPWPGALNLEWIISHPDLVTPDEIASFDRVYAASQLWPDDVHRRWGLEVHPLLQATDPAIFNPGRATFDTGEAVLFVGNSRGVFRTSLRHALEVGADVTVHGSGWGQMLPEGTVASTLVDNADLGAMYASAGVVLNDHWEDMRVTGFVSNRLMDAAASGARVATDIVPGVDLAAMFGGLVLSWQEPAELARLLEERDTVFPDEQERVRAAEQVAREHSFAARATELLDDAVRLLRARGGSAGS